MVHIGYVYASLVWPDFLQLTLGHQFIKGMISSTAAITHDITDYPVLSITGNKRLWYRLYTFDALLFSNTFIVCNIVLPSLSVSWRLCLQS